MPVAACYLRVSTEDQTEYSPDAQLAAIRKYCRDNGIDLDPAHIYRDDGISGRSAAKRPGFQAMIAAARRGDHPFDLILVHKLDRFARSREDSVVYKSLLQRECRVRVVSVTEPIADDKTAIIMEPILEAMAEYYSANLSEEVKKGMTQKALRGELQSTPSWGYRAVAGKLVPDPELAPVVRSIFERFAAGEGFYPLARWLNESGFRTYRGNRFENRTVEYMLRNPVYIGKLRWTPTGKTRRDFNRPETILADAAHEPLVTPELFDAAQRRVAELKSRHPYKGKPDGYARKHWLCGIIRCAACGSTLTVYPGRGQRNWYFHCNGFTRGGCTHTQNINVTDMEEAVLRQMTQDATTGSGLRFTVAASPSSAPAPASDAAAIAALERRLGRLREAFLAGIDTLEEYRAGKQETETQLAALRARQPAPEPSEEDLTSHLRQLLQHTLEILSSDTATTEQKHRAAEQIIQSAKYSREDGFLSLIYRVTFDDLCDLPL